ncbi:MAG: hypothetical protein Q9191_000928 [Dirinaria sp. TL-2023a]
MAINPLPSVTDMHRLDRPAEDPTAQHAESKDNDIYRMIVLRFENGLTEEDVDQRFLQMALDLGINVPQDPKTTLDIVTKNVSALSLTSAPSDSQPPPSRNSHSTHPPSDTSSEQRPTKTSSLATASITSAASSLYSSSSSRSSYTKIKRGLRRISAIRRRKTIDSPIPALPFAVHTMQAIRPSPPVRPAAQDRALSHELPPRYIPPNPAAPRVPDPPPRIHPVAHTLSEDQYLENLNARHRSINSAQLKRLRTSQIEEQNRFVSFENDQYRLLHFKHDERKRALLDRFTEQEKSMQDRHTEALVSLEHRHLSAEVDLIKTLEMERQGCETRLKHMQAYCDPRSNVQGMPSRVVTKKDYRQLEQQYHIRNGMDNLHKARINVLREKQGKQLERVSAKQEAELEGLADDYRKQMVDLDASFVAEDNQVQREFAARKKRLLSRWALAEAIERRKLENSNGETYGALPEIHWPDRREDEEQVSQEDDSLARDAAIAQDAATMNML